MAEAEVADEDYEYGREEAAADISSDTEIEEEADQQEVEYDSAEEEADQQEMEYDSAEEEEPEFDDYEEDPDF